MGLTKAFLKSQIKKQNLKIKHFKHKKLDYKKLFIQPKALKFKELKIIHIKQKHHKHNGNKIFMRFFFRNFYLNKKKFTLKHVHLVIGYQWPWNREIILHYLAGSYDEITKVLMRRSKRVRVRKRNWKMLCFWLSIWRMVLSSKECRNSPKVRIGKEMGFHSGASRRVTPLLTPRL